MTSAYPKKIVLGRLHKSTQEAYSEKSSSGRLEGGKIKKSAVSGRAYAVIKCQLHVNARGNRIYTCGFSESHIRGNGL